MQMNLRIRFSSKMLFGDSMLRRAAAASFVSMLSSVPETVVSVHQMTTNPLIRNTRRLMLCIIDFFEKSRSNTGEWLQRNECMLACSEFSGNSLLSEEFVGQPTD